MFSQMVKGVLEGCLLAVIADEETYGYEIMEKLEKHGFTFAKEGSIYPILLRLEKERLIAGTLRPSPSGPNRKYYCLTEQGERQLVDFRRHWRELNQAVNRIIEEDDRG